MSDIGEAVLAILAVARNMYSIAAQVRACRRGRPTALVPSMR
jgi:hypothetical protein